MHTAVILQSQLLYALLKKRDYNYTSFQKKTDWLNFLTSLLQVNIIYHVLLLDIGRSGKLHIFTQSLGGN